MGLFAHSSKSAGAGSKGTSLDFVMMDLESEYEKSKLSDKPRRSRKSKEISNANIELQTSQVTGYRSSRCADSVNESCAQKSVKTVQASNSSRESRSVSVSKDKARTRSTSASRRGARSRTPRNASSSQRQGRSVTPKTMRTTVIASGSQRQERSVTPKTMRTTVIASGSQRGGRSTISTSRMTSSPRAVRSKSAEPSMRKSRSVDVGIEKSGDQNLVKSKSTDIGTTKPKSIMSRSRSADPLRIKTTETLREKVSRFTRSLSPSNTNVKKSSKSVKSSSSTSKASSKTSSSSKKPISQTPVSEVNLIKCIPFGLGKDMTYLADGMNLDKNMRYFLAAFDAGSLEDFYLMSDADFSALVQKAKSSNRSIPPLQMRKVQMLRRWITEIVDENVLENDDENSGSVRRRRKVQLIPKDWKEQYNHDLPHLKIQLKNQSESLYEKIRSITETFGCGASMLY